MDKSIFLLAIVFFIGLAVFGCSSSEFKATPVIEGQDAPHGGVLVSPDMIVEPGDPIPFGGLLVWFDALDDILDNGGAALTWRCGICGVEVVAPDAELGAGILKHIQSRHPE